MLRPLLATALAALLGGCAPAAATQLVAEAKAASPASFALLELFTSEGCSDTPPSERATNEIVAAARAQDARIFAIAWHVDYWDQLGWKDLYAVPGHAVRQGAYAARIGDGRNYTPQTVVNGRAQIAGTDRVRLDGYIRDALARPAAASVALAVAPQAAGGEVRVGWKVAGAPAGATLMLVLVERGLEVTPTRGENAGRLLAHAPVARATALADLAAAEGTASLPAVPGLAWDHAGVVALLQDPATLAIEAAAAVDLTARAL